MLHVHLEWVKLVSVQFTSLPRGMPLPRTQVRLMTLDTKVLKVSCSFSITPRRMVLISGTPEPASGIIVYIKLINSNTAMWPILKLLFYMCCTNSMWGEDLGEACGKGDEGNGAGDPD